MISVKRDLDTQGNGKKKFQGKGALILLLSFLVPVLIFAGAWAVKGIAIGGKVTPLIYDMYAQMMSFIASLRYFANGHTSWLYSWGINLGSNALPTFAYYMASPLNWITLFFDLRHMPDAIYVLSLLKIGLCGLSFSIYLRWGLDNNKPRWIQVLFSSCYALMSFVVLYIFCIIWIDGIILLPIILLGTEYVIRGNRGGLYFLGITFCFLSNFYISYMVGVFTAVYLLCRVIMLCDKSNMKTMFFVCLRFGTNTLLGLGCAMLLLFPALKGYAFGRSNAPINSLEIPTKGLGEQILISLKMLMPQSYSSVTNGGSPVLYCGSIMVVLTVIFFLQKRKVKEKICWGILLLVPFLGYWFSPVDYVLHGFQKPHDLPYRYAFMTSAAILILAYMAWIKCGDNVKKYAPLILIATIYTFVEVYMNASIVTDSLHLESHYQTAIKFDKNVSAYESFVDIVNKDEGFYRLEEMAPDGLYNIGALFGFNGCRTFASTFNYAINGFLHCFGSNCEFFVCKLDNSTPFLEDFLGVKYIVKDEELTSEQYTELARNVWNGVNETFLYKNEDAMSLGFVIPERSFKFGDLVPPAMNQNWLASLITGENISLYDEVETEQQLEINSKYKRYIVTFRTDCEGNLYLWFDFESDEVLAYLNELPHEIIKLNGNIFKEIELESSDTLQKRFIIDKALLTGEDTIEIILPDSCELRYISLHEENVAEYQKTISSMRDRQAEILNFGKRDVRMKAKLNAGDILLTTIPFDGGWSAYVDGNPVDVMSCYETLLAVKVPEGEHIIDLVFFPEGLLNGIIISCTSTFIALLYFCKIDRIFSHKSPKKG